LLSLCALNMALFLAVHSPRRVRAQQRPTLIHTGPTADKPVPPPAAKPVPPPAAPPAAAAPPPASAPDTAALHHLPPAPQRTIILLDPAHGGPDNGATINDHVWEKDVTLALAARLRTALQGHNFTVLSTRTSDPAAVLTADQRAEIANHSVALACLVLHATSSGYGVHLFTSPLPQDPSHHGVLAWDKAQSAFAQQSAQLVKQLDVALTRVQFAVTENQTALAPLDNLTCPAVAVEIAPLLSGSDNSDVTDANYQQRVAEALATALVFWRGQNNPTAVSQLAPAPASTLMAERGTHRVKVTP